VRIISGKHRGKQLHPPKNLPVRPTTDFAREGLFNILNNLVDFEDLRVLDLFAGTGSISCEFISRGSGEVIAIDNNYQCSRFIEKMATELKTDNLVAICMDAFQYLERSNESFDLVFADPPYNMEGIEQIPELVFKKNLLRENGLFILEHSKHHDFSAHPRFSQKRVYGNVNFSFFQPPSPSLTPPGGRE